MKSGSSIAVRVYFESCGELVFFCDAKVKDNREARRVADLNAAKLKATIHVLNHGGQLLAKSAPQGPTE